MNKHEPHFMKSNQAAGAARASRIFPVWLSIFLTALVLAPARGLAEGTNLQSLSLHIAFTPSSFKNINTRDATTAMRIFAQTAGKGEGYDLDVEARLFENADDCAAQFRAGKINMAILDTWDYLGMNTHGVAVPVCVELDQNSVFKEYLLLTHKGSGLTNIENLRGKDLMLLEGKGGDLSRAWLDYLLLTRQCGTQAEFFGKIEPVVKPASAVLPVFFGSKPACLVDRTTFALMAELNPQVGRDLAVIAVSDPYVENVTCVCREGWPSQKSLDDLILGMERLQFEPAGQQVLQLFKVDRLVPFKDEYLDSARKLQQNLALLRGIQARR